MKVNRNGKGILEIFNHFKMEIKIIQHHYLLNIVKVSGLFLLLFLTVNCSNTEPRFTVKGDPAITKDLIVNVETMYQNGNRINTVYYNGKSYDIDNQDALRYRIYMCYQNRYFYSFEMDNLHHKIKGEPLNEITIQKKEATIVASYKPFKGDDNSKENALEPAELFFTAQNKAIKQKFISFYKK